MSEPAISTEGLSRRFGEVEATKDLTFEVPRGAVFGFLGPNGAGKTTTIRLLLGILEPSAGSAKVLGLDTRSGAAEIRARTGALLEHPGLYERLSAYDNLDFYGRIAGMSAGDRAARAKALLEHIGLWDRRNELAGKWSRGMKQKLAVARALFCRPALVFLDEPTAGLDPEATVAFRKDLEGLASKEGTTVFLTTHNLAEAEKVCDHLALIRGGRLVETGTPRELLAKVASPRVRLIGKGFTEALRERIVARPEVVEAVLEGGGALEIGLKENAEVAPLVTLAIQSGAEIEETRRAGGNLEDAYMALMGGEA